MATLDGIMYLAQHILEVLRFQIPLNLHVNPFDLLHVAEHSGAAIIDGHNALHELIEALRVLGVQTLEHVVDGANAVVDDLDAVMEIGELVLLGFDAAREHVLEHLLSLLGAAFGVHRLLLLLLLLLLLVWLTGIFFKVLLFVGLLACVRVCGGDNKFVDFERIRVFSA
jgi:hypothetical protein